MKFYLPTLLVLIVTFNAFSQKISGELSYPLPVGGNYIANNNNGIIDLGAKLRFIKLPKTGFGLGINGSVLTSKSEVIDGKTYIIQPRAYAYINVSKLQPSFGIGYSFLVSKGNAILNAGTVINQLSTAYSQTDAGLNFNFSLKYKFFKKCFLLTQYDYIRVFRDKGIPNTKYNTNVGLLKFGIGFGI